MAASRITVREYLNEWLEASASRVRPTTLASYRMHVEQHIAPRIGGHRLQDLTPLMVERLYANLLAEGRRPKKKAKDGEKAKPEGLSPNTVRRIASTLHKALTDATKKKLLPFNPADAAELPKVKPNQSRKPDDVQAWTLPELMAFLRHVHDDRLYALWRLAAWTGMRLGELVGLRWPDVDFEKGVLGVRRARVMVGSNDIRESEPKTARGRRRVDLDAETCMGLSAWRDRQSREQAAWPGEWPDHDLVFTHEDGAALRPDFVSRSFKAHVRRTQLPTIRLHDLRHTHATLMLAAEIPLKVVSERLGHANPAFTMNVYQHVLPGQQREAVQRVADAADNSTDHGRLRVANA